MCRMLVPIFSLLLTHKFVECQDVEASGGDDFNISSHGFVNNELQTDQLEQFSERRVGKSFSDASKCAKAIANIAWTASPDANLSTPQIIAKYGYPVEQHKVTTEDGYVLTMFRIPRGKINGKNDKRQSSKDRKRRPAVLIMHGMLQSSSDWLMNREDNCLPYILANEGYDVWLGNIRGTSYSQGHVRLSTNDLSYWKFSSHEMGIYDIPAEIDYILKVTKESKLHYIGFSLGTTQFFIAMSEKPEYNRKVRSMIAMAPVAFVSNSLSPLYRLAPFADQLEVGTDIFAGGRLIPEAALKAIHPFGPLLCAPSPIALTVCGSYFFLIQGFDPCQFNTTEEISNIVGHTPNDISARTMVHLLQLNNAHRFREYNYGPGHPPPKDYNLTLVTSKVAVFWGPNDILIVPKDANRLARHLPNVVENIRVDYDLWNHLDFTYAIEARKYVYDKILVIMSK